MSRHAPRRSTSATRLTSRQLKKVRFNTDQPLISTASGTLGAPIGLIGYGKPEMETKSTSMSIQSFVDSVRQTLGPQSNQYHEFATAMADLLTLTSTDARPEMNPMRTVECIEQIVMLLDGHPGLVANFEVALPPGFSMDLQQDAVVIKVCDVSRVWNTDDTGHGRTVRDLDDVMATLLPSDALPRVSRSRGRSSFGRLNTPQENVLNYHSNGVQSSDLDRRNATSLSFVVTPVVGGSGSADSGTRLGTARAQNSGPDAGTTRWNSSSYRQRASMSPSASNFVGNSTWPQQRRDAMSMSTMGRRLNNNTLPTGRRNGKTFVSDVKKALHRRPDVYHKFVGILKRYHELRLAGGEADLRSGEQSERLNSWNDEGNHLSVSDDVGTRDFELETIREVVTLLKARPDLVLAFNDFLPDGYRIRMFEKSAYVIEYPTSIAAHRNFITAGMRRLTVAV